MKYYIIPVLILIGAQQNSFAQQEVIDSLEYVIKTAQEDTVKVKSLSALSKQYRNISDFDKAMQYAESALLLANKLNYSRGKADVYYTIGNIYIYKGNFTEALKNSVVSLTIWEEIGDKQGISTCYNNIGRICDAQGNYAKALESFFACLKIQKEIGNKKNIANSYNNIGAIYRNQGNYAEALGNYFTALKIFEDIGYKEGFAMSYNNIGIIYRIQGNYAEALEYYIASLKIREELGDKYGIGTSYLNIGNVFASQGNDAEALENYFASLKICEEIGDKQGVEFSYTSIGKTYESLGNYPEALKNYLASLKISEEIGDKDGLADNYNGLGLINIRLGNFQDARKYLEDGLALSKQIGAKSDIQYCYESLSRLDSAEGNFAQSLAYYKMSTLYKDSLLNEESNNQIAQLKIQYETEKKDQEIELLNKDKALQDQQLEKERLVRNVMIAGAVLFLLLGLLLFRSFRLRKKLEQQQAITQERKRISADLHDDVGSGLSKIMLLSELVKKVAKTPETRKEAEKISTISQELSSNISEIIWALNSNNDYVENLVAYIRRYAAEYFENGTVKLKITTPAKIDHIHISGEHRRNIFFAVKEALHNIIKHAQATEAQLNLIVKNDLLSVVIHDNGIGMPDEEQNRFGNGLNNMKNRMKSINGDFSIENHLGTKITLLLPV